MISWGDKPNHQKHRRLRDDEIRCGGGWRMHGDVYIHETHLKFKDFSVLHPNNPSKQSQPDSQPAEPQMNDSLTLFDRGFFLGFLHLELLLRHHIYGASSQLLSWLVGPVLCQALAPLLLSPVNVGSIIFIYSYTFDRICGRCEGFNSIFRGRWRWIKGKGRGADGSGVWKINQRGW